MIEMKMNKLIRTKSLMPIFLLILVGLACCEPTNLKYALNRLEDTTKSFMLFTSIGLLLLGFVVTAAGAVIYLKKLKGIEKRETLWVVLAYLIGGLGVLMLLSGIVALLIYLFLPNMINSMMGAPPS